MGEMLEKIFQPPTRKIGGSRARGKNAFQRHYNDAPAFARMTILVGETVENDQKSQRKLGLS
ncbi:MAG: hypothetical protein GY820_46430 [Gammaproteobacteria bacterium]|nr:hypothetical protein [Gammaproteobacteria bacterium]